MDWIPEAHWAWLGAGLFLLVLEIATGSLFLLWPGVTALALAALAALAPSTPLIWQLAIFAALAVASTYLGRAYFKGRVGPHVSDRPMLNRRGAQLAGRKVWAIDDFDHGEGRVRLDDGQWRARLDAVESGGMPTPVKAGEALTIVRVEGSTLIVTPT